MDPDLAPIFAICAVFIGLPWLVLHYVTRWKTASTLTNDDETLIEELYQLARRLEERMETVERLAADNDPEYRTARHIRDGGSSGGSSIDFNQTKERIRR